MYQYYWNAMRICSVDEALSSSGDRATTTSYYIVSEFANLVTKTSVHLTAGNEIQQQRICQPINIAI